MSANTIKLTLELDMDTGQFRLEGNALKNRIGCWSLVGLAQEFLVRDSIKKVSGVIVNTGKPLVE